MNYQHLVPSWPPDYRYLGFAGNSRKPVGEQIVVKTDPPVHIDVAVAVPVFRTFTYSVPDSLIGLVAPGKRVLVPFSHRRVTGYVLAPAGPSPGDQIKGILDILDEAPIFPAAMIPFFQWIARYYFFPIGSVIKSALPAGLNLYDVSMLEITPQGDHALENETLNPLEKEVLIGLQGGPCPLKELVRKTGRDIPRALMHALTVHGLIVKRRKLRGGRTKPKQERFAVFQRPPAIDTEISAIKHTILDIVRDNGEMSIQHLKQRVPQATRHLAAMEKKGLLSIVHRRVYRDPLGAPIQPDIPPELTGEQKTVVDRVLSRLGKGFDAYLLAGVTGSGKTEVYMRLAAKAIERHLSVIVMVPEIALITQMEGRFRARFGERVAVLHSGLSAGERFDQWARIAGGEAAIAIGARSAIFAPFPRIGMIIVDEEHDGSYKQETGLTYNARDLAVVRARQDDAVAVLGSATPSVQSHHNVSVGKFNELVLTRRVQQRPFPEITVVDLRNTRDTRGSGKFITPALYSAMKETLARGNQVLLFLNRRGYASCSICASCGESLRCPNCDIPLTLHLKVNAYKCHYCGLTRSAAVKCPGCGSASIKRFGLGTERLAATVSEFFPRAGVVRMDRDTTTRKGAILKILKGIKNRSTDILVGTQMVAKGHDFPNITLVGIVCADLSLSFPDFRAGERTFQLLAQVSGRAGRGDIPGRVILQTYNPEHFSIQSAERLDYDAFYKKEIGFRKALNYPPFSRIVLLKISGRDKDKTIRHAAAVGDICHGMRDGSSGFARSVEVMGPIESPMAKIAGRHRWQILLKGTLVKELREFTGMLRMEHPGLFTSRDASVVIDVDPYSMS